MSDDGSGADVSIRAIGLPRATGRRLRATLEAAEAQARAAAQANLTPQTLAAVDEPQLLVSLQGVEVAIATRGDANIASLPLEWSHRRPTSVARCADGTLAAFESFGPTLESVAVGTAAAPVEIAADGGCVPSSRAFSMDAHAFDEDEWPRLVETQECPRTALLRGTPVT